MDQKHLEIIQLHDITNGHLGILYVQIDSNLPPELHVEFMFEVLSSPLYVYFLLFLVLKGKGRFCKIYHFFFPPCALGKNDITIKTMHLCWTKVDIWLQKMVAVDRNYLIIIGGTKIPLVNFFWLWMSDGYLDPVGERVFIQKNVNLLGSDHHFLSLNCSGKIFFK